MIYKKYLGLAAVFCFAAIYFFVDLNSEKPEMTATLAVAVLMMILWVTEAIPMGVTSLLPVVLFPLLGILDGKIAAQSYINYIIFLFMGGFLMSFALERTQLHERIALKILSILSGSPIKILLGFMLVSCFLSMWISNTATTMLMIPIAFSVYHSLEKNISNSQSSSKFNKALLLGIAYSASIGGVTTLIGTIPNLAFTRIFEVLYPNNPVDISFSSWFLFALPLTILMILISLLLLYFTFCRFPKNNFKSLDKNFFKESYKKLGPMSAPQKRVFVLFFLLIFLWIFRKSIQIGDFYIPGWSILFPRSSWINDGTSAMLVGLLLFMIPSGDKKTPLLTWDIFQKIPWGVVFLLGGGFALAKAIKNTGLSDYLGEIIANSSITGASELMLGCATLMSLATELTSNTATTEMLLPIISGVANKTQIHPLFLMLPVTLAASMAFMFPVATPPNAIVFGTGKIKIKDMLRVGVILNFIAIILIFLLTYFWAEWVFGVDFKKPFL